MSTDSGNGSTPATAAETAVAIVGVGCRFPGDVRTLDDFGRLLTGAADVFTEVPAERWGDRYADPAGGPGTIANGRGAFLADIDRFDAPFFGISPREAGLLDPQQRLILEVAWEAMSDSGRPRESWRGSRTAVLFGLLAKDYELLHARTLGVESITQHHVGALEFSFAAGRLAYTFDLTGPVATLNSACSSSLLAVHQACQSLRAGECDTALAGGVSLLVTPDLSVALSRVGALSPTGRCRPFDAAADGIVRGEGAGVVVLKRLADALADGDRIHAVIRGSAANNDGTSMGLTVPNGAAQADLLETALSRAGLSPAEVDYVEAHGTGTAIGDVIEVGAIGEVYGAGREAGRPLLIGSHKALLGHMDAAAGIGGLLKTAWIVNSATVPGQPYVETPNPNVDWQDGAIAVPAATTALTGLDRPARAGVSSFGLSGTNVHVIVEAPPAVGPTPADEPPAHPYVLLASATAPAGLAEQLAALRESVAATPDGELAELAAATVNRRTHESHRHAVVATDRAGLLDALEDAEEPQDGAYTGVVPDPDSAPEPVFVYAGQGGQWAGMALDLYESDRTVRETLDEIAELVRAEAGWSLVDEIRDADPETGLYRTGIVQPAIFAVQVAMTRWLAARGVRPGAILGHSLGEVAAAHSAGVLSLPDAVTLIVRRSETLGLASGRGLMYAVTADEESVTGILAGSGLPVTVVAVNGPGSLVVAGPADEVAEAARLLEAGGLRCRRLRVDAPAHSPLIADLGPRLEAALGGLRPAAPAVRMLSTVDPSADRTVYDAAYWVRNFTSPVRLWPAVDRLLAEDDHPLVEIGPHPVLVPSLAEAQRLRGRRAPALPVLSRYEPGQLAAYRALARLHVAGAPVDWAAAVDGPRRYRTLPVPSWQGGRYWLPGVERGQQGGGQATGAAAPARIRLSLLDAEDRVTGELYAQVSAGDLAALGRVPASAEPQSQAQPQPQPQPQPQAQSQPVSPAPARSQAAAVPAAAPAGRGLAELVTATVREVLGLPADQAVPRRRGLFEQGLDSLTAVSLRRSLEQQLGVTLPTTLVFERPTVKALAEYLAAVAPERLPDPAPQSRVATVPRPDPAQEEQEEQEDGIAVIGLACRLPAAPSPAAFWDLLNRRGSTAGDFPADRLRDPVWAELGDAIALPGSYLEDLAQFDAPFFRISPREAKLLDPQQRLFLETAWEALEDAGCPTHTLAERPVGVYAGLALADYQFLVAREMEPSRLNLHHGTGTSYAALAGRLSYLLGLRGPSMTVDTACSSSLTAVHLACQALRAGDCEVAVVGGASAITAPSPLLASMAGSGALAADGRCKTFDEDADGFACGEGAVALILKPLSAALRDGDRVHAVLRGSAVNQDGATGGLTVPNPVSQVEVVRQALDRAGWAGHEVDYVETHGTGTPLGDPIEVHALAESLGAGRGEQDPLLIGSAKANVGHLGAAAGAVGLLKVVLALRNGTLPPHLLERPSSRIDWDRVPVEVVTESRPWPAHDRPARAGVSAFGVSGSNAHVVVEQFVPRAADRPADVPAEPGEHVLLATAATPTALRAVARGLAERLGAEPGRTADIVRTATRRRSLLEHRLAVVGTDAASLTAALTEAAEGTGSARTGRVDAGEELVIGFRYGAEPATGATTEAWAAASPVYRRTLAELTGLLAELAGPAAGRSAALVFCHQAAATDALRQLGVAPHAVAGEGPGAATAAWADGRLTAAEALRALLDGTADGLAPQGEDPTADCDQVVALPADGATAARLAARLFAAGVRPAPARPGEDGGAVVDLPAYPWEHQPYWYRDFAVTPAACWPLSAPTAAELRSRAARLRDLVAAGAPEPGAVARTLAARPGQPHRLALVGEDGGRLLDALGAFADHGELAGTAASGSAPGEVRPVLVFPGQGWQWERMGARLLEASPVFAATVTECSELVEASTGWSVLAVLRGEPDAPSFERVDVVQPVMFSVMLGLARLWESAGVRPAAVVGHSQGEIAAACAAGALSVEDAVRVVVARSAALVELAGGGAMLSVTAGPDRVAGLLAQWPDRLWPAAVNGPSGTVVAGEVAAAEEFMAHCAEAGVRVRRIPVDYASHTPHVEAIREQVLRALGRVEPRESRIPMYSTLTGALIDTTALDGSYWLENLRNPVRFQDATNALLNDGFTVFVEASAHPVLTMGIGETAEAHPTASAAGAVTVTGTLRRDEDTLAQVLTGAARIWTAGVAVDWTALQPAPAGEQPLDLPLDGDEGTGSGPSGTDQVEKRFWRIVEQADAGELAGLLGIAGDAERDALRAVLPTLSHWWQQRREAAVINAWRYRSVWRPLAVDPASAYGGLTGVWLVAAPAGLLDHDLVTACLREIDEHGGKAVLLPVDTTGADRTTLAEAFTGAPVGGVLSLLALDESAHPGHPAVPAGLLATVHLLQAMDDASCEARFWSATRGAIAATDDEQLAHPLQAHVWGLSRVAGLETPQRLAGVIDLPPALDATTGALLCAALAGIDDEDQLALRDSGLLTRRIVRDPVADDAPATPFRPEGTSLVTGGTGALGGHVARWLSRQGGHVLLVGRQGPDAPGAAELAAELTGLGAASVTVTACDIADRESLARVIDGIPAERPLRAVFHTAGVVDDGPVNAMAPDQLERVLLPKTRAVANLDELTAGLDLKAFVLYSSAGSMVPNVGQGAYAAGNAYLDAFAEHRRARGRTTTSIAWGAWSGQGMAGEQDFVDRVGLGGMDLMTPHLGVMALLQALGHGDTAVAIANVDWDRFAERFNATRPHPFVAELVTAASAGPAGTESPAAARLAQLTELEPVRRRSTLLDLVRAELATVLGFSNAGSISPGTAFKDFGIDSVTAVELRNRIVGTAGLRLSPVAVFDHPTAEALTEHLLGQFPDAEQQQDQQDPEPAGAAPQDAEEPSLIDAMSVEDLLRMARGDSSS
ncbi:type I polyketide synthase [Kitasatospora sp. NPDC057500]|uniref:type I polyketide synthase n=1 Tax=Kitasatospora sp. NPDC057500 TaxID=3346151 RepID=UPI0036BF9C4F